MSDDFISVARPPVERGLLFHNASFFLIRAIMGSHKLSREVVPPIGRPR